MSLSDKALFFFGCLGVFNGIILSVYFFFFTSRKHLSGYLLGALLLVLSIRIGKSVAYFFDYRLSRTYLQVGLTACFFIGPFLYFFVKVETSQVSKLPKLWVRQLILWFLVIVSVGIIFPYERFPKLWGQTIIPLIYLQWGVYVSFSVFLLLPLLKKITRKEPVKPFEKWVLFICIAVTVLFVSYVWAYLNITKGSYINGALWFSLVIYLVVFTLLYRKKTNDLFSFSAQKYADKKLDMEDVLRITDRLKKSMAEKELFRNPNVKLNDLAREINVSGHQLSQVLNEHMGKNFTLFVNEYRIGEACKMLSQHNNLTIEAIGDEVGFNSRSTFFSTFKRMKGVTPSAYQQSNSPDL
jgi:AraC-like DNA-binding protein